MQVTFVKFFSPPSDQTFETPMMLNERMNNPYYEHDEEFKLERYEPKLIILILF